MAKLSQQQKVQQPERTSRTQRVESSQEFKREKKTFENLRSQAEKKQEELKGATFEEYSQEYNKLNPNLQSFFSSPQEVLNQKTKRISTTKQTIQEKLDYANGKITERKAYYNKKISDKIASWNSKSSSYQNKTNKKGERYRRLSHKERLDGYEDGLDEDIAKWEGYKKGLSNGIGQLNSNKDISFSDIESYALDVANFEESKEEARNKNQLFKRKQTRKIKDLEKRGYTPEIIERSFKGNPLGVDLLYYNKLTRDYQKIASYDVKGNIDVSKLTRVGFSQPTQRSVEFAGKEFKFNSRIGIYKEVSGDLVTPYSKTGLNESALIRQSQDQVFAEWQGTQKNKPVILPFKVLTKKDLPIGYGGQQSISSEPISVLMDESVYYSQKDKPSTSFGLGKAFEGAKSKFKWVDDRIHYTGDRSLIKFGKVETPTDPELASQLGRDYLSKQSQKLEDWAIGKTKIEAFNKDLETKFGEQYQSSFEKKYMKSLIYNETDLQKATTEFASSDEAKLIQRRYQDEYGIGYKDLQISPSRLKKFGAGSGRVGLSLASLGLNVASSPSKTAIASGGVYGATKLLATIPKVVTYGATGGLLVYGSAKALSPTSTIDEAGSGLVTAVLSGATLGYAGYRYLKAPVIKTAIIKQPKLNLKASEVIGRDLKIITGKGTINKIIFKNQKLSQTASAGRRTIVSTKGRVLSNRFWRELGVPKKFTTFEGNAIYRGVPFKDPSGYQKAFKLLAKYGWSDTQAKATLRYVSPRITEQYLSKGVLTIKGSKAFGEFEYLTKKPVITIDKSLGIKTRGGKTIKNVYDVERKLINYKGTLGVLERKTKISMLLNKKGQLYKFTDDFAYNEAFSIGKTSKAKTGLEYLGKDLSGLKVLKESKYKDIFTGSIETKIFPRDNILNVDFSKTKLYQQIINIDQGKNVWVKPLNIKKTPFAKTFGIGSDKAFNEVVKKLSQNTATKDVSKIINKINKIGSGSPIKTKSKFYGTGQYEQSFGGLTPTQQKSLQQQLKAVLSPTPIKAFKVNDLINIKSLDLSLSKVGQLSSSASASALRSKIKLKSDLRIAQDFKINLKVDNAFKIAQLSQLKTSQASASKLKSLLADPLISFIPPSTPTLPRIAKIPTFSAPTPIPLVVLFPFKKGKKSNARLKKSITNLAYLPDFTSRALGLKAEIITEKQARGKLKKLLTGLEIRRGVIIK